MLLKVTPWKTRKSHWHKIGARPLVGDSSHMKLQDGLLPGFHECCVLKRVQKFMKVGTAHINV